MQRSFRSNLFRLIGAVGVGALIGVPVILSSETAGAVTTTATWQSLASLPTPLMGFGIGTSKAGGLIVAGGTIGVNHDPSNVIYSYTTASNAWATTGDNSGTYDAAASATGTNGDLYVYAGGLLIYNPKTGAWSDGASPPRSLNSPSMVALRSGQILLIGSTNITQAAVNATYSYSPSTGKWTTLAPMPTVGGCEARAAATGPTGLVYSVGGDCCGSSFFHKLFIFDPTTNIWTEGTSMPGTAVRGGASAAFGGNGFLYVMGGGDFSPLTQVMRYDPSTNKWSKGPSLPVPSSFGGAVKLASGNIVYAGGVTSSNLTTLSDVWELATK